jgi:adenylate cyclase
MHVLLRGTVSQRLRLASGLLLFAFAATHFFNHALGLVSLDAMVAFDRWRTAVTRSALGTTLLAAALLFHVGAALAKLASRRTLRLPRWELLQIGLGLSIPLLLLPHIVNTRVSSLAFGVVTSYPYELAHIWTDTMLSQSVLLLLVWGHGCVGLHYWLRLLPAYRRLAPTLLGAAVLLPFAALAGVVTQGRTLAQAVADPERFAALQATTHWPDATLNRTIVSLRAEAQLGFYLIVLLVLAGAAAAILWRRQAMRIPVQYLAGPRVMAGAGPTVLEVSRMHDIPHLSVCGGRGRCSTCRILVLCEPSGMSPASPAELATLKAIAAPPNVRLACQARVDSASTVMQLLKAKPGNGAPAFVAQGEFAGVERELAVLFIDIRGFTSMTDRMLAYDVVFILNQFFQAVGQAVSAAGGWINDRAGDGALALFGDPRGLSPACQSALVACAEIERAVAQLNLRLASELSAPLRIAMGLHCGPHVLGRLDFAEAGTMAVIGPAVNVASRLEALAKAADAMLALSHDVAAQAGLDSAGLATQLTPIRGVQAPLRVIVVERASDLLGRLRGVVAEPPTA